VALLGSSRLSPRNQYVAKELNKSGLSTLLIDLLSPEEELDDMRTRRFRFDIQLLATRLCEIGRYLHNDPLTSKLRIGLFGASTGGGAALVAAAMEPKLFDAVVSRGGRPDLAGELLPTIKAPTLLLVGGWDADVHVLNVDAMSRLGSPGM
jgi:dienelactone hydrolase